MPCGIGSSTEETSSAELGQVGSRRRVLIKALGWPLKEGYTKETLEKIGRLKATLNLAITADQA